MCRQLCFTGRPVRRRMEPGSRSGRRSAWRPPSRTRKTARRPTAPVPAKVTRAGPRGRFGREEPSRGDREATKGPGTRPTDRAGQRPVSGLGPARGRCPVRTGSDPRAIRPVDRLLRAGHHGLGGRATDQRARPPPGQGDGAAPRRAGRGHREEFIPQWLETPCEGLGGLKPVEVLERGEADRLWRVVLLIGSGMPT